MPSLSVLAADLRAHADTTDPAQVYLRNGLGWRFGLSRYATSPVQPDRLCIFSATLVPKGRGSTIKDWETLGAMLAALRVPAEAMEQIHAQSRKDSNQVLKAIWREPA